MEINKEIEVFKEEREIEEKNETNEVALVDANKELTYPKSGPDRVIFKLKKKQFQSIDRKTFNFH